MVEMVILEAVTMSSCLSLFAVLHSLTKPCQLCPWPARGGPRHRHHCPSSQGPSCSGHS